MPLRTRTTWIGVVLDAPDARELAGFYRRLLGWTVFDDSEDWVTLAPSADGGINLAFATERHYERPVWPTVPGRPQMSMHLDLEVADAEMPPSFEWPDFKEGVSHFLEKRQPRFADI